MSEDINDYEIAILKINLNTPKVELDNLPDFSPNNEIKAKSSNYKFIIPKRKYS